MGNFGKGSNTYTTNTQAPAWLQGSYQNLVGQAQNTAQTPFTPYGGELVAGVNPQEQAGIGNINQYANWAQPYLNAAAGYATSAAAPIQQGTIQQYENPEANKVTQATLANFNELNAQQNENVVGNAISSGAWGGDRTSVAQSELARQQAGAEAPTLANINLQSYNTGLQTALTEQQQQAQAAYSLGNIGTAAQNAGLTGAGAQIQGGQLQQGTQQQLDAAQMQQYYTAMGYPFQTAAWLAGIEGGIGGVAGGTSQTTAPAPNPLNTVLGLGATAAGAYLGAARGGGINIPHFDSGGAMPYSGGINFIPVGQMARGAGPPKPPIDPSFMLMYGQRGQDGSAGGFGNIGKAAGKYLGSSGGIDTSGAGSGFPLEGSADASVNFGPSAEMGFGSGPIYATGGGVTPDRAGLGFAGYADGGGPDDIIDVQNSGLQQVSPAAMDAWRSGVDADIGRGTSAQGLGVLDNGAPIRLPPEITAGSSRPPATAPSGAMSYAAPSSMDTAQWPVGPVGRPPVAGVNAASAYAPPSPGIGSAYTGPSYDQAASRPPDTRSLGEKLSLPLMQAGFAMMASHSPFLGEAIGQGGLSGIGAYLAQEKEKRGTEETQQNIELKAKQLSDLAEQHRQTLAQQEKLREETLGQQQKQHEETLGKPVSVPIGGTLVDPKTGKPMFSSSAAGLSADAAQVLGRRLANGDAGALSGLPQGTAGAAARSQIQNIAADVLVNEGGMSPADAAATVTARSQQVHATGMGLGAEARTAGTREANLNLILATTNSAIPAALEASKAVSRTGWVPINSLIQKGEVIASDPDLKAFGMANLQLAEGWARAMNPTGVMRESDRDKALSFLNTTDSPATYERAVKQLQTQIQRERDAVRSQRPATPGGPAPSEAGAAPTRTPAQSDIDYVKAHPEARDKFVATFGVQP